MTLTGTLGDGIYAAICLGVVIILLLNAMEVFSVSPHLRV